MLRLEKKNLTVSVIKKQVRRFGITRKKIKLISLFYYYYHHYYYIVMKLFLTHGFYLFCDSPPHPTRAGGVSEWLHSTCQLILNHDNCPQVLECPRLCTVKIINHHIIIKIIRC